MKSLKGSVDTLTTTVNGLETKIMKNIRVVIQEETKKINDELGLFKGRMDNMETRLDQLSGGRAPEAGFVVDTSVIIINLAQHDTEDTVALCQDLITDVLGVTAQVTRAERTRRRDERPAIIKCQLNTLDEKITVLRNKRKLESVDDYKRVFIARMRTHEERLIELNFKAVLKDLPNGDQYRFTGSGRLINREENATAEEAANGADGGDAGGTGTGDGGAGGGGRGRGGPANNLRQTPWRQRGRGGTVRGRGDANRGRY